MSHRETKVLILGDDPEQVLLLEEAFAEMGEGHFAGRDLPCCFRRYVGDIPTAFEALRLERFDIVLFDLAAAAGAGLLAFLRLRSQAPALPVVTLASREDESLAMSLVRQGAQDYLLYDEIDCAPLAHAMRCALERNRLLLAQQSVSLTDELTGLYNRRGFVQLAERDARLASSLHLGLSCWLVDTRLSSVAERQEADLRLIEAAELLRRSTLATDILGRWDEYRFAVLRPGGPGPALHLPCEDRFRVSGAYLEPGRELQLELLFDTVGTC